MPGGLGMQSWVGNTTPTASNPYGIESPGGWTPGSPAPVDVTAAPAAPAQTAGANLNASDIVNQWLQSILGYNAAMGINTPTGVPGGFTPTSPTAVPGGAGSFTNPQGTAYANWQGLPMPTGMYGTNQGAQAYLSGLPTPNIAPPTGNPNAQNQYT